MPYCTVKHDEEKRVEKSDFESSMESVMILEKAPSRARLIISWKQGVIHHITTAWLEACHSLIDFQRQMWG